jgi:hypothetical protein
MCVVCVADDNNDGIDIDGAVLFGRDNEGNDDNKAAIKSLFLTIWSKKDKDADFSLHLCAYPMDLEEGGVLIRWLLFRSNGFGQSVAFARAC